MAKGFRVQGFRVKDWLALWACRSLASGPNPKPFSENRLHTRRPLPTPPPHQSACRAKWSRKWRMMLRTCARRALSRQPAPINARTKKETTAHVENVSKSSRRPTLSACTSPTTTNATWPKRGLNPNKRPRKQRGIAPVPARQPKPLVRLGFKASSLLRLLVLNFGDLGLTRRSKVPGG